MTHTASYDKAKSIDPLDGLLRVELVKSMAFRFKSIATMKERKREKKQEGYCDINRTWWRSSARIVCLTVGRNECCTLSNRIRTISSSLAGGWTALPLFISSCWTTVGMSSFSALLPNGNSPPVVTNFVLCSETETEGTDATMQRCWWTVCRLITPLEENQKKTNVLIQGNRVWVSQQVDRERDNLGTRNDWLNGDWQWVNDCLWRRRR